MLFNSYSFHLVFFADRLRIVLALYSIKSVIQTQNFVVLAASYCFLCLGRLEILVSLTGWAVTILNYLSRVFISA